MTMIRQRNFKMFTSLVWMLHALPLLVTAYQPGFILPGVRSRKQHTQSLSRAIMTRDRRRPSSLQAVAEFEELKRERQDNNDGDDNNDDDVWIPTASGGFLPNFFRRHQQQQKEPSLEPPSLITEVSTLQDYKHIVADESHEMVAVLFYAPWCRACKATQPLFRKLARDYSRLEYTEVASSQSLPVKFVRVPLTPTNGFLHDGLGVPSLPYAHLYHPTVGLVEERKLNKHVFEEFRTVLGDYVKGDCSVDYMADGNDAADGGVVVVRSHVKDEPRRSHQRRATDELPDEEPSMS